MTLVNPGFQISVTPTPRMSSYLLNQELEILAKHLKIKTEALSFGSHFKDVYPYSKLLPGPQPTLKLIAVFRKLFHTRKGKDTIEYPYFGLFLVDLSYNSELKPINLLRKIDRLAEKARDVAVHPNNQIVTVFFENRIENYVIESLPNNTYGARLMDKHNFKLPMIANNIVYHPSGQYLVGLNVFTNQNFVKAFKFDLATKDIVFGENLINLCVSNSTMDFLAKWNLAIDKNSENQAMITAGMAKVCLLNLNTMKVSLLGFHDSQKYKIRLYPEDRQIDGLVGNNGVADTCGYINGTNSGSFISYQSSVKLAHRFQMPKTGTLDQNGVFVFLPNEISQRRNQRVKCVDIVDINALACIQQYATKIHISKIDRTQNLLFDLKKIQLVDNSTQGFNKQQLDNMNSGMPEDIVYSKTTSQICTILNLRVACYQISTNCTRDIAQSPIALCNEPCKAQNSATHWNPMKMSCSACSNCYCNQSTYFNPYFWDCTLDCSHIKMAAPDSEYGNNKKCACLKPYSWDESMSICRFNCSTIPYTDNTANLTKLNINQCKCITNFKFMPKLNALDTAGHCQLICPDGNLADLHQNHFICNCSHNYKWNPTSRTCVASSSSTSSAPLTWAIVLLVLLGVLLLAIIGFLIWKKKKGRKANNESEEVPVSSARQQRLEQAGDQKQKTQEGLKDVKVCSICNIHETEVNCMGPCGHYYHFYCIKQRLDENNMECPECLQVFPNGIGDMKSIEKEDEVFTISDT